MATVRKIEVTLSDGSKAYDVVLKRDEDEQIRFAAYTEFHADQLIEELSEAIHGHTTDEIERLDDGAEAH